jgi:preprotein translocase SecF subunit
MTFSFVKNRYTFYVIALALLLLSLLSPFFVRLNLGIDMTGGMQIEYSVASGDIEMIIEDTRDNILKTVYSTLTEEEKKIVTDTLIYRVSGTDKFVIEAWVNEDGMTPVMVEAVKSKFVANMNENLSEASNGAISQTKYVNIGASFGQYIKNSGFLTLTITIIAISLYIMYAFSGSIAGMASWPFAVVTGVSLVHDVIVAFWLYVLTSLFFPEFKIDTFFLTAMLTILGYSINDTIVVMDRIRSNLETSNSKKISFSSIIDQSIHETMRRSIFTSLTVIIVLVAMFIWGPDSLRGFTLALIFGGIVGTYSSVCLASPLLVDITGKK